MFTKTKPFRPKGNRGEPMTRNRRRKASTATAHRALLPKGRWCSSFTARVILPLTGYGRGKLFGKPIPMVRHGRTVPGKFAHTKRAR